MATKKQQRRRQKLRRHEYEEVLVDAEGRVVEADDELDLPPAAAKAQAAARGRRPARRSSGRVVQPPSWGRVGKRGLLFAPLMFLVVTLLAPDSATLAGNAVQTLFLLAVFLPFSYVMDSVTYRMWRKRTGAAADGKARSS